MTKASEDGEKTKWKQKKRRKRTIWRQSQSLAINQPRSVYVIQQSSGRFTKKKKTLTHAKTKMHARKRGKTEFGTVKHNNHWPEKWQNLPLFFFLFRLFVFRRQKLFGTWQRWRRNPAALHNYEPWIYNSSNKGKTNWKHQTRTKAHTVVALGTTHDGMRRKAEQSASITRTGEERRETKREDGGRRREEEEKARSQSCCKRCYL